MKGIALLRYRARVHGPVVYTHCVFFQEPNGPRSAGSLTSVRSQPGHLFFFTACRNDSLFSRLYITSMQALLKAS